jgi:putative CocE/NonD family hydrolase
VDGVVEVSVPMRDGAVLHADLYLPPGRGPHPTLVHRTAYGTRTTAMVVHLVADPAVLAAAGYAVLVQDVRGRFASEGEWEPFVHEAADGYDTVEWAAAQPWSSGRVAVYGSSYMGIATYQVLAAAPPHLAAAAVWVAGSDPDNGLLRTGGALELGFLTGWNLANARDTVRREGVDVGTRTALLDAVDAEPWSVVRSVPLLDHPALALSPALRAQVHHEAGDPLWRSVAVTAEQVGVPLLQVVGLRDWMAPSMLTLFRALQEPSGPHRLVAGPWTHHSAYAGPTGERDLTGPAPGGPAAHTPTLLAFLDQHLRDGVPDDDPVVRYYSTGDDTWRASSSWPPEGTTTSTWFTGPDGALRVAEPGAGVDELVHDPRDPVPTVGGSCCHLALGPSGIVDHAEVARRPDVLTWTGPPLVAPLRLAGEVSLELVLTTTAADADVVVFLVDVHPDGYAEPVTDGVLRTRYRLGGTRHWLVPGEATPLVVRLADTAHTLAAGHRLRLELAGSSFPRFAPNPGTRVLPELATPADLTTAVHHVDHGARVVLRTCA